VRDYNFPSMRASPRRCFSINNPLSNGEVLPRRFHAKNLAKCYHEAWLL
jgi:hypothetical protein